MGQAGVQFVQNLSAMGPLGYNLISVLQMSCIKNILSVNEVIMLIKRIKNCNME